MAVSCDFVAISTRSDMLCKPVCTVCCSSSAEILAPWPAAPTEADTCFINGAQLIHCVPQPIGLLGREALRAIEEGTGCIDKRIDIFRARFDELRDFHRGVFELLGKVFDLVDECRGIHG